MPYAILRVEKIKTAQQGAARTAHNYRLRETPNADAERKDLNHEYFNPAQRNYWELATERIQEAGAKVRPDSVRAMEVILTASPEVFKKDAQGQSVDMRGSKWAEANVAFLQAKFGKENVVAMSLHQDELTPHFQAIVVPITADGRLSAKDLFNPKTLRALQTEYAQAMKPFGLERGVEHSRAKHETMRHVYGAQERSRGEVGELSTPMPAQRLSIEGPGPLDLVNLSRWKAEQEAKLNAELTRQLAAANERAEKAAKIAQDSSTARDRAQTLRRQLASVEGTKATALGERDFFQDAATRAAVWAAQGETPPAEVLALGSQVRAEEQAKLEDQVAQLLKAPMRKVSDLTEQLRRLPGYDYQQDPDTKRSQLRHLETGSRFALGELKPGGVPLKQAYEQAVQRTQQRDLVRSREQSRDGGMSI
ncbi:MULTISPECIES: MobV family relaxase [Hymenobacter]|uniref:MobV family relaxase n=1 Tax=Hymenobacter TaxID=89966 RepID=UPI0013900D58|nr:MULTISPECIES: MobV family relaxase [Hymenobacter]